MRFRRIDLGMTGRAAGPLRDDAFGRRARRWSWRRSWRDLQDWLARGGASVLRRFGAAVFFGLVLAGLQASPIGQRVEHGWGLAALYWLRGPVAPPPGAMIVALDDAGAEWLAFVAGAPERVSDRLATCLAPADRARLGEVTDTLQLPRVVHACLSDALAARGARMVVYDIVFRTARQGDARFAEALAAGPPFVLLEGIDSPAGTGALRRERPAPIFAEKAAATAFFRVATDPAGLVLGVETHLPAFPTLATLPEAVLAVQEGRAPRPGDGAGPVIEPLWQYGPAHTVPTVALRAVFDDATPPGRGLPGDLSDTVVFVGISDPDRAGETDHFRTVVAAGGKMDHVAGVEIAATAFLNHLHGQRLRLLPPAPTAALTALLGGLAVWMVTSAAGWRGAGRVMVMAGVAGVTAFVLFAGFRAWLPLGVPVALGLPLVALGGLVAGYGATRATLHRRLVRPVAEAVLQTDGRVPLGVREQAATILFVDIVGSVALSDRLSTLVYSTILTRFQADASAAIEAEGGIVVEIEGDSLMAVFVEETGAEPHARRACRAARTLSDVAAAAISGPVRGTAQGPAAALALRLRMGLDTGPVMLGEVVAGGRYDYRAVGAVVNTAKRLEQGARDRLGEAGSTALVSDAVREAAAGSKGLVFDSLGLHRFEGKTVPVMVWQLQLPRK